MTTTEMEARVELKYCVPELVAADVLDRARQHLVPEPLARGRHQRITSLYLDTPDLMFLRWHRQRATDRYKLRIRAYGELPSATIYLETKCKRAQMVRKERSEFASAMHEAILDYCRTRGDVTPRTLITVVRESLRAPGLPTAVTVDRALQFQATTRGTMLGDPQKWQSLPLPPTTGPSPVLLELKFGADAPLWMAALRDQLAHWRISFSKYATAMTHGGQEPAVSGAQAIHAPAFTSTIRPAA